MAEDRSDKPDAQQQADAEVKGTGKKKGLVVGGIVAAIMLVEAGAIVVAMKLVGGAGPQVALAGGLELSEQPAQDEDVEVTIAELKAPNERAGQVFVFDVKVCALVPQKEQARFEQILERKKQTIADRLNQVIRSAEPQELSEEGLQTIRRQIRYVLAKIVGDEELIKEILIPRFMKFRADY